MSGEILHVLGSDHDDGIERAVCHVAAEAILTTAAGREIEQWFGAVHAMLPEGVRECSTRIDGFMEGEKTPPCSRGRTLPTPQLFGRCRFVSCTTIGVGDRR
jgi:hypothetical protein